MLRWGVFAPASVVIGQPDPDRGDQPPAGSLQGLPFPLGNPGVSADGRRIFVAHLEGLKGFSTGEGLSRPIADFNVPLASSGAALQGGKLVHISQDRLRIFNSLPTRDEQPPDVVVGGTAACAANGLNQPGGAYITPLGQLVVADRGNNRVLIWKQIPQSGEGADFVVGQSRKDVCAANAGGTANEHTLNEPTSVWSDDRKLVVVDQGNNRVLIFDFPTGDFQAATGVLGQGDFTGVQANAGQPAPSNFTLDLPSAVDVREDGQMAVSDAGNHRVLVWDRFPTTPAQAADQVIGQRDANRNASNDGGDAPTASTLSLPVGVRFHDRSLVVVDQGNHRVLVFRAVN